MTQGNNALAVEMRGITKQFGDFVANDKINFELKKGEVHAILGENGAGKSTMMNMLYGLLLPTEGEIFVNGNPVRFRNPNDAIEQGIGMVHQHFMLVQPFTVAENIVLGREPTRSVGLLDMNSARSRIKKISETYGLFIEPDQKIRDITVGMQQRVEIIKALYRGAEVLILDEPTAVLTPQEIHELGEIITNLKNEGKSIIIITHKLAEIKAMADRCTIIRRGKYIGTIDVADVDESQLASMMVGREVTFQVPKGPLNTGEIALEIDDLRVKGSQGTMIVNGFSMELRKGEIVGIAGVDGNGQSQLVEAITGLRHVESGKVLVNGKDITGFSPRKVIEHKVGHIPEDRQKRGLVLDFSIEDNIVIERVELPEFSKHGILKRSGIADYADRLINQFDIRPPKRQNTAGSLSGGNQQKVIIAREVAGDPDILIASQPTRGLDVGAIEYVHKSLVAQRDHGKAVLLVSFELDEILNLADRIYVIFEGKVAGILEAEDFDENSIGLLMAGGRQKDEK